MLSCSSTTSYSIFFSSSFSPLTTLSIFASFSFLCLNYVFLPVLFSSSFLPFCCSFPPFCQPPWQVIQILWALRPALPKWWILAGWELFQVYSQYFLLTAAQQHCIRTDSGSNILWTIHTINELRGSRLIQRPTWIIYISSLFFTTETKW